MKQPTHLLTIDTMDTPFLVPCFQSPQVITANSRPSHRKYHPHRYKWFDIHPPHVPLHLQQHQGWDPLVPWCFTQKQRCFFWKGFFWGGVRFMQKLGISFKKYLRYMCRHFWVDDFPAFPFRGILVIPPWSKQHFRPWKSVAKGDHPFLLGKRPSFQGRFAVCFRHD